MIKKTLLVTGGTRSGKSRYALSLGREHLKKAYIATAQILDEEMRERVRKHRSERDASFTTVECPLELPQILLQSFPKFDFILVDCLTLWLSNCLLSPGGRSFLENKMEELLAAVQENQGTLVFVSNEVGMGIVPDTPLGREFRDWQGSLNQKIASAAQEVVFMVAGLPMSLKKEEWAYGQF